MKFVKHYNINSSKTIWSDNYLLICVTLNVTPIEQVARFYADLASINWTLSSTSSILTIHLLFISAEAFEQWVQFMLLSFLFHIFNVLRLNW